MCQQPSWALPLCLGTAAEGNVFLAIIHPMEGHHRAGVLLAPKGRVAVPQGPPALIPSACVHRRGDMGAEGGSERGMVILGTPN